MKNKKKQVILLSTHLLNERIITGYRLIAEQVDQKVFDIVLLYNTDQFDARLMPSDIVCFQSGSEDINQLGYIPIAETLSPGSCHFPVLRFYRLNPSYVYYWFVEYDVEFSGTWATLMNDCTCNLAEYDFLSCHIEKYSPAANGDWPWWYKENNSGFALDECLKSFNPICRYSPQALNCIDQFQRKGLSGHSEVTIPTCLYHHGMKLGDFGGTGKFTPLGYRNKYYVQGVGVNNGTMRWRPLFLEEEVRALGTRNKLFHPVKE